MTPFTKGALRATFVVQSNHHQSTAEPPLGYTILLMSSKPPMNTVLLVILSAIDTIAEVLYQPSACCDSKLSTYQAKAIKSFLVSCTQAPLSCLPNITFDSYFLVSCIQTKLKSPVLLEHKVRVVKCYVFSCLNPQSHCDVR